MRFLNVGHMYLLHLIKGMLSQFYAKMKYSSTNKHSIELRKLIVHVKH